MRFAALILFLFLTIPAIAQQPANIGGNNSRAELERKRQSILASIRESQEQLEETKKNKNATMSQLRALQAKLDARLRLINNINQEMREIAGNIQASSREVEDLRKNLEVLKIRYAQSIRYAYKSRSSSSMLAFLFSANNYRDAIRRLKYLRRYRDYRIQQAEEIAQVQNRIEHKIGVLNVQKSEKNALLSAEEQQRQVLQQETKETNNVVLELKGKEKQLIADIEKNRKIAKQVDRAVAAIIAREIEEQRKKALEEAQRKAKEELARAKAEQEKKAAAQNSFGGMTVARGSDVSKPTASAATTSNVSSPTATPATTNAPASRVRPTPTAVDLNLTPEAQALSNSFAANRSKLPWPVERGTITGYFGPHKHPVANVTVDNNGVDIQTSPGASVRAVFEGTVTGIFSVDGAGKNILITHGDYFTVYTNLSSVSVSRGQVVHTKQSLGTVGLNDDGLPVINFQIWKSAAKTANKLNPADWIAQ